MPRSMRVKMKYLTLSIWLKSQIIIIIVWNIEKNTTSDYKKFIGEIIDPKIKQKELVKKSDVSGFVNDFELNKKEETLATKAELKAQQDKIIKLETYDLS